MDKDGGELLSQNFIHLFPHPTCASGTEPNSRSVSRAVWKKNEEDNGQLPIAWGEQTRILSAEKRMGELERLIDNSQAEKEKLSFEIKSMKLHDQQLQDLDDHHKSNHQTVPCTCTVLPPLKLLKNYFIRFEILN